MEDCEGVAVEIDHTEKVNESEEVDERTRGGVHEDDCENEYVERVEITVSKGVVCTIFAFVTD